MQHLHGWSRWSCSFARTPWFPKLSETCSRAIILSSAWCFCCSSTFKATHEKHGAKYLQSWLGNNIQVHHSWKKTAAHQLYSHSGYHIIQDPIKTSSTSIQLTCIFWPQYPTLPHKTSKILLVLSSSRRSLLFSPLSSADLPKWVKPGKPWKPRIQGRPPEVWDKNQELRPLVSCQNVGQTKGFEVLMCFIRSKKKHTHTYINLKSLWRPIFSGHSFSFQKRVSTPNLRSCSERRCRIWATDLKVGGLLVTVTSHWPRYQRVTNRKLEDQQEMQQI